MARMTIKDYSWWFKGACAGMPTELFFQRATSEAKAICIECPVRIECLTAALDEERVETGIFAALEMMDGVRGGLTFFERWKLLYPEHAKHYQEREGVRQDAKRARDAKNAAAKRARRTPEQIEAEKLRKKQRDWARRGRVRAERRAGACQDLDAQAG